MMSAVQGGGIHCSELRLDTVHHTKNSTGLNVQMALNSF